MRLLRRAYNKFRAFQLWMKNDGEITSLSIAQIMYHDLLLNRKVIVTGGSDGIGLAIARKMIDSGAEVLITGRNAHKLEVAQKDINNPRLHTIVWDVSDMSILDEKLNDSLLMLDGCDIFINNAAYVERYQPSEDYYDKIMLTNLKAVHFICLKLIDYYLSVCKEKSPKKIINISSLNAFQSAAHPYYYSKRGVTALTEGLGKKYAPYNIIINAVAPGICASSINYQDYHKNAYYGGNYIHRIITPEEIAEITLFLSSDAANGIVGQTIICDGGETLL